MYTKQEMFDKIKSGEIDFKQFEQWVEDKQDESFLSGQQNMQESYAND